MKKWYVTFLAVILVSCTDYVSQIEDERDEWRNAQELAALSSSSVIVKSSSSVKSDESSSSVILSGDSREESSSSTTKSNSSSSSAILSGDSREESCSSSIKSIESSSSAILSSGSPEGSSSSEEIASSSSSKKDEISSSSEKVVSSSSGKASWAYLNPAISYGEMTDSRDGQVYKTVVIGEQTWMAENLNYRYMGKTLELDSMSFCYDNLVDSCYKYGRLYTWAAVMDSVGLFTAMSKGCGFGKKCASSYNEQGVCPDGWRLPNMDDYETLFDYVGGKDIAGKKLKSLSNGYWLNNGFGDDSYGFSVLPSGTLFTNGMTYGDRRNCSFIWSSSEKDSLFANLVGFNSNFSAVELTALRKNQAFSVRCLKKGGEKPVSSSSFSQSSSSKASWAYLNPSYSYGEMVDDRDGQVYKTVEIGVQTWMAENLNYAYLPLEAGSDSLSFCYDNDPLNCSKYGRLYRWSAAMDSAGMFSTTGKGCGYSVCLPTGNVRGVCPEGWHLPSKNEIFNSDYSNPIYWQDSISSWYMSGLTIPASGYMPNYGVFGFKGEYAGLWTSSEVASDGNAFSLFLRYDDSFTRKNGDNKNNGYSVRCVKD